MSHTVDHLRSLAMGLADTRALQIAIVAATALSLACLTASAVSALGSGSPADPEAGAEQPYPTLDFEQLAASALFGALDATASETPSPPATRLDWVLQGVFTGASPQEGSAIIAAGDKPAQLYQTEQSVAGGARLLEVHADRVVLGLGGQREVLRFPNLASVAARQQATPPSGRADALTTQADKTAEQRRELVRQRLELLRQRALGSN